MKYLVVFMLMFSLSAFGQGKAKIEKLKRDSAARVQLADLKEGALLVRLRSNLKKFKALEKRGDSTALLNARRNNRLKHLEIVNAFRVNYDFSEVYFFMSHHSTDIKNDSLQGIVLNDSLEPIQVDFDKFLVVDPYRVEFESMNTSQKGLSVMDENLKQLSKPFPYYVRKRDGIFFLRRDQFEMVQMFQKNLDWAARKYGIN